MDEPLAREMYQEHILDAYKYPSNFGTLENATHTHREHNPLCGDDITIQLVIEENKVKSVKFKGRGCAISMASASFLTDMIKGKTKEEISQLNKDHILELLQIPIGPVRLKCALLSLETVQKALQVEKCQS